MSKSIGIKLPRFKKQRRLGIELPGLGKPGATERRPYPPGQHGNRPKKLSEYSLRLMEKQKILFHYSIREKQLRKFVRDSKKGVSKDWVESLIGRLERRLDNVVFRLGLAPSMRAARQMIRHGHVLLNGKKATIGSMVLKIDDEIRLTEQAYKGTLYFYASRAPRLEVPSYLKKDKDGENYFGKVIDIPKKDEIPFPFEPNRVAEYYAARSP